ncbi:MAG: hypothetical protein K2X82_08270 [Gemmataceae bacterium]|nr:hypothetical protein [Gemmataceae bacterium]
MGADDAPPPAPLDLIGEVAACTASPFHFIDRYCQVYAADKEGGRWVPFRLWPAQVRPLQLIVNNPLSIHLKARQLGLTWLCLGYALHNLLFLDGATVLLFSRRDTEAMDLMRRLKGMFDRLPDWLKPTGSYTRSGLRRSGESGHQWLLPNGGRAMAFPTSAGDSYTASLAIVDEADLIPDLNKLLGAVKPTIDGGGKLVLVSRSDKSHPDSPFKRIYRGAAAGANGWAGCFLPWYSHPGRTWPWYRAQVADSLARTFSLDAVHEQYPATDEEALAAAELDKRFPGLILQHARDFREPLPAGVPVRVWYSDSKTRQVVDKSLRPMEGLRVYERPVPGVSYTLGGDPAQGLPGGNDSALVLVRDDTLAEVLHLRGKLDPRSLGRAAAEVVDFYRTPPGCKCTFAVERNNHGHAVVSFWRDNVDQGTYDASMWRDADRQPGWDQTGAKKELMYHRAADAVVAGRAKIRSPDLYQQVAGLEAATLSAPEGSPVNDDSAVAWGLAVAVATLKRKLDWDKLT